jgi:hypothetical protein
MRRLLFVLVALILPIAAAAEPFGKSLPKTCAQLRGDGWSAPRDPLKNKPMLAEMNVPGVLYMCMLTRVLPKAGSGHAPDLQALLSDAGKGPSIILSASIWCEADRTATADALAKQLERTVGSIPESVTAAVRAWKKADAKANGLTFEVEPVEVDSDACRNVPAGQLGAVLVKMDVKITPAK